MPEVFVDRNCDLPTIEKGVRNKLNWCWLEEKDSNGDFLSHFVRKITDPCGNPKRYTSADVVQMRTEERKQTKSGSSVDLNDETESDHYIKTLLNHQTRTDVTLKGQFSQHRNFIESSSHAPTVNKLVGLRSSEDHVNFDKLDSTIEYLKSCGLTKKEIAFKLQQEAAKRVDATKRHGLGADPASHKLIEKEIERKLTAKEEELKKPDRFNGGLELSRQALVLEKSILERQSKEATLPGCVFKQKEVDASNPDDPINHIHDILSDIEPKPSREPRRERRRKRKLNQKFLRQQKYLDVDSDPDVRKEFMESVGLASESQPDILNREEELFENDEVKKIKTDIISKDEDGALNPELIQSDGENKDCCDEEFEFKAPDDSNKTKKKKNISKLSGTFTMSDYAVSTPFLTDEEIVANRLSLQEILSMAKFQHYDQGNPNLTVFVKNLPNNVTESDLVFLFGRFQHHGKQDILLRLLNGRMKGQAFVSFPDANTAGEAISMLNGFMFRGKPVILSYGKKQDGGLNQ